MALTSAIRRMIKAWLLARETIISRPPGQFDVTEYKLRKARERGLTVSYAIDGGAHVGEWTRMLDRIFPGVRVLMVEPREDVQARLVEVTTDLPNAVRVQSLLGPRPGNVAFHASSARSSVLADHAGQSFGVRVQCDMAPIDDIVARNSWPRVDLIKLDLQGYELEALAGAGETLPHCQAVVLEVSFLPFQSGMPLAVDVFSFMKEAGFTIYDILALTHRPLDGRMGQADVLFLRNGHELLRDVRWSSDDG